MVFDLLNKKWKEEGMKLMEILSQKMSSLKVNLLPILFAPFNWKLNLYPLYVCIYVVMYIYTHTFVYTYMYI